MSENDLLMDLWRGVRSSGQDFALATLVRVQGSSYKKPGARILITKSGSRAGTVSGGCLEAEIARKIWWFTERGPHLERFVTSSDELDGYEQPQATGCGGALDILFERGDSAQAAMELLQASVGSRAPSAIVRVIESSDQTFKVGSFASATQEDSRFTGSSPAHQTLGAIAVDVLRQRASRNETFRSNNQEVHVFGEYLAPPLALLVFGAGDDARPLVALARLMGWQVTIADARGHLANRERFPSVQRIVRLDTRHPVAELDLSNFDAAVIMTHSHEQDRALLHALLPNALPYLGILGARHRTRKLVNDTAARLGLDYADCMAGLRSPVGLPIGADTPETIALSIVAEIQEAFGTRGNSKFPRTADRLQLNSTAPIPMAHV